MECYSIIECGSTLYVGGLTGIVQTPTQKSTGMVLPFFIINFFLRLKWASSYTGAAMNK